MFRSCEHRASSCIPTRVSVTVTITQLTCCSDPAACGDECVHLLRGDVLRADVLRADVLRAVDLQTAGRKTNSGGARSKGARRRRCWWTRT